MFNCIDGKQWVQVKYSLILNCVATVYIISYCFHLSNLTIHRSKQFKPVLILSSFKPDEVCLKFKKIKPL